ncbi:MAG TPA: AAA family ATPase [Usitatibacter sp.]|jgi:type II secretory pathway predicted ATPase ExeA|nr:AAA family ATPase [Usitatibacter sp.]
MTMYLGHFGLREAPFRITPHTEFFFSGANRGATLEALLYAITAGEGMVKVTGEVGSGKTMLCRVLMERLPATVETIYLAVPSLTRDEMLAAIAADLEIETAGANTTQLVRALQERLIGMHAEGKQVVALIDEAHAMPLATLEEIRLLSNLETEKDKLLQIALFGQPELDQHLALPHMRQLKERITHSFVLGPLPSRDVHEYVNFRLRAAGYHGPDLFGPEALRLIAEASEGLTRRINIYADKTLLAAFAAGTHTVTPDHARAAISDTQIVMTRRGSPRRTAAVAAVGAIAGIAIGFAGARYFAASTLTGAAAVAAVVPSAPPRAPTPAVEIAPAHGPAAPGLQTAAATVSLAAPSPPAAAAPAAAGPGMSLDSRLAAGRQLLDGNAPGYSVQLMVTDARSRSYLEHYLADASHSVSPDRLYLVPAAGVDTPRLGLLFGHYRERGEAVAALDALPEGLRQFRPYVRSLEAVRDDARRTPDSH